MYLCDELETAHVQLRRRVARSVTPVAVYGLKRHVQTGENKDHVEDGNETGG
ncbi:hypothetical protein AArcMg_3414 [Natrarchaeobaculum sulfurireducens]|uniref:Uncharacterized protein n=1 Tax=Natrarchaeobaculum sulfurireducens TaxID=2044521 RepID=A0A346PJC6_9EURY|nr:hypothetical protein AArc1_3320 [Natrarchaeobaculum sulfurireducens]AXR83394.1 hypothetical protein AArcMg_3414 [Natrarchaeobaculum sulfurireducens]